MDGNNHYSSYIIWTPSSWFVNLNKSVQYYYILLLPYTTYWYYILVWKKYYVWRGENCYESISILYTTIIIYSLSSFVWRNLQVSVRKFTDDGKNNERMLKCKRLLISRRNYKNTHYDYYCKLHAPLTVYVCPGSNYYILCLWSDITINSYRYIIGAFQLIGKWSHCNFVFIPFEFIPSLYTYNIVKLTLLSVFQ